MNRTIYVTTSSVNAPAAKEIAHQLRMLGHQTTSLWHDATPVAIERDLNDPNRERRKDATKQRYDGIYRADTLLLLAERDDVPSFLEAMCAYRDGKKVLAVGDPFGLTAMVDLPGIRWFATIGDAMAYLAGPERRA